MSASTIEQVQVVLEVMTKRFGRGIDTAQNKLKRMGNNIRGFNHALGENMETFKKTSPQVANFGNVGAKVGSRLRTLTHGLRGFRMEMLGVMFFGMGMQKFFTGLLQPALEVVGIFDLWRATLQLLFLPLSLLLLDFLMPIFLWLMNLDDGTKLLIGKFALLGLGIGSLLALIGTFALGIGSIILAFGGVFTIISRLIPDINVAGVNISSFIEAGLGISLIVMLFNALESAMEGTLNKLLKLGFIKELFDKMEVGIDNSMSAWDNFKNLFISVWDTVKEKFNIDDEGEGISGWINSLKNEFKNWFSEIQTQIDELGVKDMATSFSDFGAIIKDITPSIKTFAGALQLIADALNAIADAYNTVRGWFFKLFDVTGFGSFIRDATMRQLEKENAGNFNDFIWRPGQSPISVNPNDTLVGFKGDSPNLGEGNGASIVQENNYYGFSTDDLRRELDNRDRRIVDDIRRIVRQ